MGNKAVPKILISGFGSISPLGSNLSEINNAYRELSSNIKTCEIEGREYPAGRLSDESEKSLNALCSRNKNYPSLDRSVLMAIYAAGAAIESCRWNKEESIAVNIGSSRGATSVFEASHRDYLNGTRVPVLTSPTTTLGNISSWVMQDLKIRGMDLSHSVTCSTGLHAILNAVAWLRAGMSKRVLAGASEAPLTGYTIAQMRALRIYSDELSSAYPCRPCAVDEDRGGGMVLGEGSAVFALEVEDAAMKISGPRYYLDSFGYASEQIYNATSISAEADCISEAMRLALDGAEDKKIDAVILHAPGTSSGDQAEMSAVKKIFGDDLPLVISNKWKIGHTLGAAGVFNLEYALWILKSQSFMDFPYKTGFQNKLATSLKRIMINAAGFGGNAVSLIVSVA